MMKQKAKERSDLTEREVATIVQHLACRCLNEDEIVEASLRAPQKTRLLEPSVGGRRLDARRG
jgi:aerobic-type carbon monoxide dehydrogenase small subunit (CoxS/CutS family)